MNGITKENVNVRKRPMRPQAPMTSMMGNKPVRPMPRRPMPPPAQGGSLFKPKQRPVY